MVRDVKNGDYDYWCKAKVTKVLKEPGGHFDVLEMQYTLGKSRITYTVLSSRIGGIIRPLDDDVATVLSFGSGAVVCLDAVRL